jgi:hypothetical protein
MVELLIQGMVLFNATSFIDIFFSTTVVSFMASAPEYYVNHGGNDNNSGLSEPETNLGKID